MELNEQEKERIIAEEKLRMETRKEFFQENFGGGGMWRGRWHGHGCHGHRYMGFGIFKALVLALAIFGLFHLWHHPCGAPGYYYGYPSCPAPQMAAPQQPPVKN